MEELFGEETREKEITMNRIFDKISDQKFDENKEDIDVKETAGSSIETTKTIAVQRLIEDEYLADQTFKALKIEDSYKDSTHRYIVIETEQDKNTEEKSFEVLSVIRTIDKGITNYQEGESKNFRIVGKDAENLSNIAKSTRFKLSLITEQLER